MLREQTGRRKVRGPARGEVSGRSESWNDSRGTTIERVVRVLQALLSSGEARPLADLADQLEMPKPTVHRLLMQLENVGMVQRDLSGKEYTVGPRFLDLATSALSLSARQPPLRLIIRGLVDRIRESCNLSVLQDHEIVYLERVECDWPLRLQLQAGSRVPVHCTASGKLFLAHMAPQRRARLLKSIRLNRYTEHTITDPDALEAECAAILEAGYSVNRQEFHLGLIGVAVPLLRDGGTMVAALAVHAPIFRMSIETAQGYVPLLRNTAAEIAVESGLSGRGERVAGALNVIHDKSDQAALR